MGKCKFRSDWLKEKDCTGHLYGEWCTSDPKNRDSYFFCRLCQKSLSCGKGFDTLKQHAKGDEHKTKVLTKLNPNQLRLAAAVSGTHQNASQNQNVLSTFSIRDPVYRAEIMWCMKCLVSDFPGSACDGIGDLFKAMLPCEVSEKFVLSSSKFKYLVNDGLYPYFRNELIKDIKDTRFYVLEYDETTNFASRKELQIRIRYVSPQQGRVVSRHLETSFIGEATSEKLKEGLLKAMNNAGLQLNRMITLSSDGPFVNKKVFRLVNEQKEEESGKTLLDIGTCNLHIVNNAYHKSLQVVGDEVADLVIALYYFFHGWPLRCEDFESVQKSVSVQRHKFVKHVPTRWLTLVVAAERVVEQWPAIRTYFLDFVPKKRVALAKTGQYKKIVSSVKSELILAKVHFVIFSALPFQEFSVYFQKDEPLVHSLVSKLRNLVHCILSRVLKPDYLEGGAVDFTLLDDADQNAFLALEDINCGEKTRKALEGVNRNGRAAFLLDARKHYVAAVKHLAAKIPSVSKDDVLFHMKFLDPASRKNAETVEGVVAVARQLPICVDIDRLRDEWALIRLEEEPRDLCDKRIDTYWLHLLTCNKDKSYPNLTNVIWSSLIISHGSASVERGFSESKNVLDQHQTLMLERTLNAKLTIKDALKPYCGKVELYPISSEMISYAKSARMAYEKYLESLAARKAEEEKEEEKKQCEKEERLALTKRFEKDKESIDVLEKKMEEKKAELSAHEKISDSLLEEATRKLDSAVKSNDLIGVQVAKAMLDSLKVQRDKDKELKAAVDKVESTVSKRKLSLISDVLKKIPKKGP